MTASVTKRALFMALVAGVVAAGLFGRLSGFGERPLAVDEYYFWKSIELILDHGVPRLADGGYYLQGVAAQYLMAASVLLFGESEAALRFPALLAGLLAPMLACRYARGHLSRPVALAVAAAILLSSWEIEFSRFARMYTLCQCATLMFLTRLDRSILGPDWNRRYLAHVWLVAASLCHFQGALLAPLLFLPALDWNNRERFPSLASRIEYFGVTSLVTAAAGWFASFDFRRWGAVNLFPEDYTAPGFSSLRTPAFPLWSIHGDPRWNLAFVAAALLAVTLGWLLLSRRHSFPELAVPLAVTAAALHQGALAILLAGLLLLRSGWSGLTRRQRTALIGSALVLGGWAAAVAASGASLRGFYEALFGWPNLVHHLWKSWAQDLPVTGLLALAAIAVLFAAKARQPWIEFARGPAAVLAYWILCLGVVRYFYDFTRYSFFLYPVVLAAIAVAIARFVPSRLAAAAFLGVFCLTGDFDPVHIARSGADEVAFRLGRYRSRAQLWYPRLDYRGAAQWLETKAERQPDDLIIVDYSVPVSYYLRADHAVYLHRDSFRFYERSRQRGTVELWSRRRLLSTPEEVDGYTRDAAAVWLVRSTGVEPFSLDAEKAWAGRRTTVKRVFLSGDGQVEVLRIALADSSSSHD